MYSCSEELRREVGNAWEDISSLGSVVCYEVCGSGCREIMVQLPVGAKDFNSPKRPCLPLN